MPEVIPGRAGETEGVAVRSRRIVQAYDVVLLTAARPASAGENGDSALVDGEGVQDLCHLDGPSFTFIEPRKVDDFHIVALLGSSANICLEVLPEKQ